MQKVQIKKLDQCIGFPMERLIFIFRNCNLIENIPKRKRWEYVSIYYQKPDRRSTLNNYRRLMRSICDQEALVQPDLNQGFCTKNETFIKNSEILQPAGNSCISVQFHISIHRWCFVHKQPRVWELTGPDVSVELEIKDTTESNTSAS